MSNILARQSQIRWLVTGQCGYSKKKNTTYFCGKKSIFLRKFSQKVFQNWIYLYYKNSCLLFAQIAYFHFIWNIGCQYNVQVGVGGRHRQGKGFIPSSFRIFYTNRAWRVLWPISKWPSYDFCVELKRNYTFYLKQAAFGLNSTATD